MPPRTWQVVFDAIRTFLEGGQGRYVITAAHCLPQLPPPHPTSYTEERTYAKLLSSIKRKRRGVWAECFFVDPVADLAVLGSPDNQALWGEAEAYNALTERAVPLPIGQLPVPTGRDPEAIELARRTGSPKLLKSDMGEEFGACRVA